MNAAPAFAQVALETTAAGEQQESANVAADALLLVAEAEQLLPAEDRSCTPRSTTSLSTRWPCPLRRCADSSV